MMAIYRYDGRGHLYDLHEYDTARTAGKMPEMTEEEKRIEDLCDEERYLELHTDIAEKAMYEGQLKHFQSYPCKNTPQNIHYL